MGWANSSTATTEDYAPGAEITLSSNKTLYAVWSKTITTLILNFDLNGIEGAVSEVTCTVDIDNPTCIANIPSTTLTREGYNFLGWANSSTATTEDYAPGAAVTLSHNKTLYAVWEKIVTTLILDFNLNGAEGTVSDVTCTIDIDHLTCDVEIPAAAPTRDNYTFLGWADTADAESVNYNPGDSLTLSADKTIYAIWQEKPVVPEPDEPGSEDEDIEVPDTSATPETGANTKIAERSASVILCSLPVIMITAAAGLYIVYRNHKRV